MKKLFVAFALLLSLTGKTQSLFITKDSIDINNINATQLLHGDMWWDPQQGVAKCFFPKSSSHNIGFASSLWMSGYDGGGQLHVAAQTYRQNGTDYWPGTLFPTDTLAYATSEKWARFWKVNRSDIDTFLTLTTHTVANTPEAILHWPGRGNPNAGGFGGTPISVDTDMAPFVDFNGNGIYEPLLGEFPDFFGDQAMWWVFSDNGPTHTETHGIPLGVEVQVLAHAYQRNTMIDNVVFYDYKIVNRSANTYHNFRFGQWADMDLGYYFDDYIGFDSVHRMGIIYNGTNDDGAAGGHPPNSFGTHIPIAGITMIVMPGDVGTTYMPAGCFDYYNNDNTTVGNPMYDYHYDNMLRAKLKDGSHFSNDFTGRGIPSHAYGSGLNCNYVFPGNPSDTTQWSECNCGNSSGDRRFIIASNDFTLSPGATVKVVMALVTTFPDTLNGCPTTSFDSIKMYADTAWNIYYNPLPSKVASLTLVAPELNIYPNPATGQLFIADKEAVKDEFSVTVYNTFGQIQDILFSRNSDKLEADISKLTPGIYYLKYQNGAILKSGTFIKK